MRACDIRVRYIYSRVAAAEEKKKMLMNWKLFGEKKKGFENRIEPSSSSSSRPRACVYDLHKSAGVNRVLRHKELAPPSLLYNIL